MKQKTLQGLDLDCIGLGTYKLMGAACEAAVLHALDIGYRHIDTARIYNNEEAVGTAIKRSSVKREDIFLTSKVWISDFRQDKVKKAFKESLKSLQVDTIDLYLLHWPSEKVPLQETLGALEDIKQNGYLRYIGVSNFPSRMFEEAAAITDIICNQVEYHPFLSQEKVLMAARKHHAFVTAYSPLMQGHLLEQEENVLGEIARKHQKTIFQVSLRWLIEQDNVIAIPKAASPSHQRDNYEVTTFQLDSKDITRINALNKNRRQIDPAHLSPKWD